MRRRSARPTINRLYDVRNRFGRQFAVEKRMLLITLPSQAIRTAADTKKLHDALCFIRAFPDSLEIRALASAALENLGSRIAELGKQQQENLADTGITTSDIHYSFSFEVAIWLARRYPGSTEIDWPEFADTGRLDELLEHILEPSETDYFDSGLVSTEGWLKIASAHVVGTDFDWLMAQLLSRPSHTRFWASLYNAADIPLRCRLSDSTLSASTNLFAVEKVVGRTSRMQNRVAGAKKEIARPARSMARLNRERGSALIDVAMASLAVRHRETLHFNYANANEVYLAEVGRGVQIAVTGLLPESRYPLETTMGFLLLSNGVPIGYGGASILFRQVNTGINIFEEYRGSEAAWLWVQVMRVFHTLTGCTRYIANPYQFGSENTEALKSGAFWFYYRLGYRPAESETRQLAKCEFGKLKKNTKYRTPIGTLKNLASCDMHLTLPGARQSEFFDENWIETSAQIATRRLAAVGGHSRRVARKRLLQRIVNLLEIKSLNKWSPDEKRWLSNLCPLIQEAEIESWSHREKHALVSMIRAKGSEFELDYARQGSINSRYFSTLMNSCRDLS